MDDEGEREGTSEFGKDCSARRHRRIWYTRKGIVYRIRPEGEPDIEMDYSDDPFLMSPCRLILPFGALVPFLRLADPEKSGSERSGLGTGEKSF